MIRSVDTLWCRMATVLRTPCAPLEGRPSSAIWVTLERQTDYWPGRWRTVASAPVSSLRQVANAVEFAVGGDALRASAPVAITDQSTRRS